MINANELRIGNLIKFKNINVLRVDEIRFGESGYTLVMYPDFPNRNQIIEMSIDHCEPILITKELLINCGFIEEKYKDKDVFEYRNSSGQYSYLEQENDSWVLKREVVQNIYMINDNGVESWAGFRQILYDTHCKGMSYLHELKNKMYEIVGEDLKAMRLS